MSEYLNEVESVIKNIESIDLSNDNAYSKVLEEIKKIKVPVIIYIFPSNSIVFRSRINFDKEFFNNISQITYPKPKYVKNYARANKPEQSVFYCSENRPTAYLELATYLAQETKIGEQISITIAGWMLAEELRLLLIFDPKSSRDSDFYKRHGEAFDDFMNKLPEGYKKGTNRLFNFIGEKFSQYAKGHEDVYKITSAFSNFILSQDKVDGIIYPSISLDGKAFNIALFPEVVDDNKIRINFVSKDVFDIKETDDGKHNFVEIDRFNGKINYEQNSIEWNTSS